MTIAREHRPDVHSRTHVGGRGKHADTFVCLLTTVHPERALSRALALHLIEELPRVTFTLREDALDIDCVWLCGFEPGAEQLVADLRARHPRANLVVSGRSPSSRWAAQALAAGADAVCGWPMPLRDLERILRSA